VPGEVGLADGYVELGEPFGDRERRGPHVGAGAGLMRRAFPSCRSGPTLPHVYAWPVKNAEVRPAKRRAREQGDPDVEIPKLVDGLTASIISIARLWRRVNARKFNPSELILLGAIKRNAPISLAELVVLEHLTAPTVSRVVRSLEVRGLVERLGAADRRVSLVRLSPQGIEVQRSLIGDINVELAARLEKLSREQRKVLELAVPVLNLLLATGEER